MTATTVKLVVALASLTRADVDAMSATPSAPPREKQFASEMPDAVAIAAQIHSASSRDAALGRVARASVAHPAKTVEAALYLYLAAAYRENPRAAKAAHGVCEYIAESLGWENIWGATEGKRGRPAADYSVGAMSTVDVCATKKDDNGIAAGGFIRVSMPVDLVGKTATVIRTAKGFTLSVHD